MTGPDRTTEEETGPLTATSILFLCGLNAIRSPMAEALARALLPADVYIVSAGVKSGERDPFVDAVLAEKGLGLGARLPRCFDELEDGFFELIVTMAPEAHHVALDATRADAVRIEFWPMPDPSATEGTREQILGAYRELRDRLERKIRERFGLPDQPAA
ncbi:low molecular weight phosphatase family protein [Aurantimonas sp. MSK8Z-1]|nr:low molecular weight phosphatase family protein [Aurantimonas sp. MSK8Z-1]MCW4116425.1 low molecular weight phosphatase family protein [Aurantimonas sp. MSK8Z-1]